MPWGAFDRAGILRIGFFDRRYDPANHRYGYTLATQASARATLFNFNQLTTACRIPPRGIAGLPRPRTRRSRLRRRSSATIPISRQRRREASSRMDRSAAAGVLRRPLRKRTGRLLCDGALTFTPCVHPLRGRFGTNARNRRGLSTMMRCSTSSLAPGGFQLRQEHRQRLRVAARRVGREHQVIGEPGLDAAPSPSAPAARRRCRPADRSRRTRRAGRSPCARRRSRRRDCRGGR